MEEKEEDMTKEEFETMKRLILLQMERIEKADTLDEAKAINRETVKVLGNQ